MNLKAEALNNFSRRSFIIFTLLAAVSLGGYLAASAWFYRLGFPLDDAWIHQTYARNLALRGEWAYLPGQPSAGSTAPLWSALLAIGYIFHAGPYWWTYLLGALLLVVLAWTGSVAFRALNPGLAAWAPWAGILLILEWHLVWSAGSGMETLLFAVLMLAGLAWMAGGQVNWMRLGLWIGLSVWVRPDGITLLGPAAMLLLFSDQSWRARLLSASRLLLGVALFFLPYLLFNRFLAGAWWPNTFFAKQAEYAVQRQVSLLARFMNLASLPLVGVGIVLLPGFLYLMLQALQRRNWGVLAGGIWFAGYILMYAWRLPVTYQHGRYLIPAMPVFFVWGASGLARYTLGAQRGRWARVIGRSWVAAALVVLIAFWGLGAKAFSQDVSVIESEMVTTARWLAANSSPDTYVAAHDIGALGFYANRRILDLAGLISPRVIPFIRNEDRLKEYLDDQQVDYLVTFPGWYPQLVAGVDMVWSSKGTFSLSQGGENMAVYRWSSP
jgi:arabinofuranosyltransferase